MAGSEELGLREDTLRVLAAFLRRSEAAGSPITIPPSLLLDGHWQGGVMWVVLPLLFPTSQLASDPVLRRKLVGLSMGSFARLAELFTSREASPGSGCARPLSPCPGPPPPSPEPLARLALAMELSRRVAHLGGTLAGLSVEHVHSFAPWIQAHGGWEGILAVSPVDLNLPLD
ncbi:bcl-2-like protein 12 [Orycteropus afer afer]|uniref:Bcl-2-like protein 12 n=1 Tax=Orycteropus afer afer TaxID=1230840 RepID=A0A8B7A1F6_ORYAF|nr:bcl-2-like protein 12 [Orycteropus afer afer]